MSTIVTQSPIDSLEVVDLCTVASRELEHFWQLEVAIWRDQLEWDVSAGVASLRRAFDRGSLRGKAVRAGATTSAYGYYLVEGDRAVLSGFGVVSQEHLAPRWSRTELADTLLSSLVHELRGRRIRRIESQLIADDASWLVACFQRQGFRTHWREFLRLRLEIGNSVPSPSDRSSSLQPFRPWNLSEASCLMQKAHLGGVDAEMNELYRTNAGCRKLLTNILRQRGCGTAVTEACAMARERTNDRAMGFSLVTETAEQKAHLAQLAVAPDFQRNGVGRTLVHHAAARLAQLGYETLSLMVSSGNGRAVDLYRSLGFECSFRFPVFSWGRE